MITFLFSLALTSFAGELPVITADQLKPGSMWTWTYYTQADLNQIYSAEKYEVLENKDGKVTFQISSKYNNAGDFKAHTRFKVKLSDCWTAFKKPFVKTAFSVDLYSLQGEQWSTEAVSLPALPFEEKFNCNPDIYKKDPRYETRFAQLETVLGLQDLFQQYPKLPKSQVRSFYFLSPGPLQSVAFMKDFNLGTNSYYRMVLTEWSQPSFSTHLQNQKSVATASF